MSLLNIALFADVPSSIAYGIVAVLLGVIMLVFVIVAGTYGNLWFQAYMSNAQVSLLRLVAMSFRQVNARVIVQSKIMAMQAGVGNDPSAGITTQRLEAHYLAGGNVPGVIKAIIAAHRATSISTSIAQRPSTWPAATCSTPCKRASIRK